MAEMLPSDRDLRLAKSNPASACELPKMSNGFGGVLPSAGVGDTTCNTIT